ncbi:hypothetical protein GCM10018954_037200 [Kutzneria kofuensis]
MKKQRIADYGYPDTNTSSYEEDHFLALKDGDDPRDPRNPWPQPVLVENTDTGCDLGFRRLLDSRSAVLQGVVCA